MADQFKTGDVVVLKSGGPIMTIERVAKWNEGDSENSARCMWFSGKTTMTDVFLLSMLCAPGGNKATRPQSSSDWS